MSTINQRIAKIVESSGLSKTSFGEKINVSQQYISKLIKTGAPSDRTIADICREFNVNENWLRTGEGQMFRQVNRSDELAAFMGDILSGESPDFRARLVAVLARLNTEEWKLLEGMALKLVEEMKKEEADW